MRLGGVFEGLGPSWERLGASGAVLGAYWTLIFIDV